MTERLPSRAGRALRWIAAQALLYAGALAGGFGIFVLLFQTDLWSGVTILFYRGLLLLIVAFLLTLAATVAFSGLGRAWGLRRRDALGACVLSLSLNLSGFVILPVTVDRSVSVFLLGRWRHIPTRASMPSARGGCSTRSISARSARWSGALPSKAPRATSPRPRTAT